jgi:type II secretory pathway component PulK
VKQRILNKMPHFSKRISISSRGVSPKSERGSALIIVLWTVLILSFAVGMASGRVEILLRDTSIRSKRMQAELLADSAIATVDAILNQKRKSMLNPTKIGESPAEKPLDLSKFHGTWRSQPEEFAGGTFYLEIVDEQSKMNWVKTPASVWRKLFDNAQVEQEAVDAWLDAMTDWQDNNDTRGLNGAESSDYESLRDVQYRAKNAPIADFGELFWIMGGRKILSMKIPVDDKGKVAPLLPMTTVYGDGKINVNTAPAIFIAAAMNTTVESAQQVVRSRLGPDGLEGTHDDVFLSSIPNIGGKAPPPANTSTNGISGSASVITTTSKLFRLRGVGEYQGQQVIREALAIRDSQSKLRLIRDAQTIQSRSVKKEPEA